MRKNVFPIELPLVGNVRQFSDRCPHVTAKMTTVHTIISFTP